MSAAAIRVLKFGGSSLGAPARILRAIGLIQRERAQSPIALIVSAMGDSTDWLIEAAQLAQQGDEAGANAVVDRLAALAMQNTDGVLSALATEPSPATREAIHAVVTTHLQSLRRLLFGVSLLRECSLQTMDLVMSFGELLSATLLAELVTAAGTPAVAVDSRDWTCTDATFGDANVDWPASQAAVDALRPAWGDRLPICTGFLGRTRDGRTTTLGRNGSDYTATLFARALRAAEVVRWTDVSGVMTADPAIVRDAYPLTRLSYMEALELANFGARVFHPRTMIPLIESGIPMRIRNTMRPEDPGTVVDAQGRPDQALATSVTSLEKLAMIGVEWRRVTITQQAQLGDRVLRTLEQAGVTVWMANQAAHGQALAVVVPESSLDVARTALEDELEVELKRGDLEPLQVLAPVTLLSLVAEAMGHTVNVAGRFFHALGSVGVNIRAIAQGASQRSISAVIDAADTHVAVRTVHAVFNFAHQDISLLLYGTGTVGNALLEQIHAQTETLRQRQHVRLRVVGVVTSGRAIFDEDGLDASAAIGLIQLQEAGSRLSDAALLDQLRRLPTPVLVDCTSSGEMHSVYTQAFARGIHVVAANKKPLTIPQVDRDVLMAAAESTWRAWRYETTVGASLPVINSLKNIVRTGDVVLRIEGSFSGTLGHLTNELMRGVSLHEAVRDAQQRGFTEPNPADDLSGLDVARKALILVRELGMKVELADVEVLPLVPATVLDAPDLSTFYANLEAYAPTLAAELDEARAQQRILRYLATIVPPQAAPDGRLSVRVGPALIPLDHPAARLRGAEAFVAFTTERYNEYPLIVQGAGAGGAVTAAGVLADILSIPLTLTRAG